MNETNYLSPKSNLIESLELDEGSGELKFLKTRLMNAIAVIVFVLIGVASFIQRSKIPEDQFTMNSIVVFSLLFAVMIFTPLTTVYALWKKYKAVLHFTAIALNLLCLALFAVSMVGIYIISAHETPSNTPISMSLISGAIMFLIPQLLNLKALRLYKRNQLTN